MQTKSDILLKNLTNLINIQGELRIKAVTFIESENKVYVTIISNVAVNETDKNYIQSEFIKSLNGIDVEIVIEKAIADGDITKKAILTKTSISPKFLENSCSMNNLSFSLTVTLEIRLKYTLSSLSTYFAHFIRNSP